MVTRDHCRDGRRLGLLCVVLSALVMGCVSEPPPIVIYENRRDSVWLKFDTEATGAGHGHPYSITPEQMAKVLRGVLVRNRDVIAGFGLFAEDEASPAFTAAEILTLSTYLSEALRKASPKDMATFYLTTGDPRSGRLITSGGLFVRDGRMYFIMANHRTSPSSVQYENTYEFEARDEPLIPIAKKKFYIGFSPKEAWIPNSKFRGKDGYERYLDESKLLIIDLQSFEKTEALPSPAAKPKN